MNQHEGGIPYHKVRYARTWGQRRATAGLVVNWAREDITVETTARIFPRREWGVMMTGELQVSPAFERFEDAMAYDFDLESLDRSASVPTVGTEVSHD